MEKRMIVGVAALALLVAIAVSAVGTYAYPSAFSWAAAAGSGDCDRDRLQLRLRTQSMDCEGAGDCAMACEQAQVRDQAQQGSDQSPGWSGTQYRLMQQSHECLRACGQEGQNALQARNQIMAQLGNGRP